MYRQTFAWFIVFFLLNHFAFAQNTVGLLSYQPSKTFDGYNLLYPHNQSTVFLLDNCGEIVHQWTDDTDFRPGNTAYLLDNGNLVKTKRSSNILDDPIWAGGGGATIELRDWENNLISTFTLNDENQRLHHDIEPLDNGNILAIVWEAKTEQEALDAGRNPALVSANGLWPDYIIELDLSTGDIVWEWHAWDHLIQDFDASKANFGVVSDHPELIDINYQINETNPDWLHANAIDYNEERRQILLSVPHFDEVWIIDHTTTTEEAASNAGGLSFRGGNLMYRWGNPLAYKKGSVNDQLNFFSHDAHFLYDFLPSNHVHYKKISFFNNRVGEDFSTVNVIDPMWDMYSWSYPMDDGVWGPTSYDLTIGHPEPTQLFSSGLSSVQLLPNGNTLICSGRFGYNFEITPNDEVVWEYKTPTNGPNRATQGDSLSINNNLTFRLKRYPTNYSAFEGRDLNSQGWIELEPNQFFCDQLLPTSDIMDDYFLKIYPNPANQNLTIEWEGGLYAEVEIFDLLGRKMESFIATGGRKYLDVSDYESGVYFVQIEGRQMTKLVVARKE